jgi:CheY-like chemotaxis protein
MVVEEERPLSILLVDDHPEVRETTSALLREFGHQVIEVSSGAEALTILERRSQAIDILVTDYAMPQLSGTDLLAKARQLRPQLPALLITGYADAEEVGERPDDIAILSKPFTPENLSVELVTAVGRTLESEERKRAS